MHNYAAAEREFLQAAALDSCNCLHALDEELASVLLKQNKYQQAITYLDRIIDRSPDDAVPFGNRGVGYFHLGQLARALDDWIHAAQRGDAYSIVHANSLYQAGIPGII